MQYRPLGRTGTKVSAICLGCVKFANATDEPEARRIVHAALDAGVNFIDTAHVYSRGESERIIGRALADHPQRDRALVCTKIQPQANDRRSVLQQAERSLQRLGREAIDLLLLHRPAPWIPIDETLRALDDLVRTGKVRYLGTSSFAAWQIAEAHQVSRELGLSPFVAEQSPYSLLCRHIEHELVPFCRSRGVGLMLWSPLGAGVLTDRYSRESPPPHAALSEAEWRVIETLQAMARQKGCTASQLAFAWCLAQPGVTCPIAGPRTEAQLHDNLAALDVTLSDDELDRLDAVAPPGWCARARWLGLNHSRPHAALR